MFATRFQREGIEGRLDDAVNHNNYEEIERFLNSNLKNPNSCDIKTTFFVSHQYNNYSMVQVLQT